MLVLICLPKTCLLRELRRTPCFAGLSEQAFDQGRVVSQPSHPGLRLSPATVTTPMARSAVRMQQQDDEEEDDELIDLDIPPFVSSGTARTPAERPPNPVATTLSAGRRLRRQKDSPDDILRQAAARWAEAEAPGEAEAAAAAAAAAEEEKAAEESRAALGALLFRPPPSPPPPPLPPPPPPPPLPQATGTAGLTRGSSRRGGSRQGGSRVLLHPSSLLQADGTVVAPDGTPLGKLREDGMVVGPGGRIVGQRCSDGSVVEGARQRVSEAVARWGLADGVRQQLDRPPPSAEQQVDEQRAAMEAVMERQRLEELVTSWEESEATGDA